MKELFCLALAALLLGCPKTDAPLMAKRKPSQVVQAAHQRALPDALQARFQIKMRSKPLKMAGSTGGGLLLARPGKMRLDIFAPIGPPLLKMTTDGEGLTVLVMRDRKGLVADDAERLMRSATGGAAGMDDLIAIFVGDLPFQDAKPKSSKRVEGGIEVRFEGPKKTRIHVVLDESDGALRRLEAFDAQDNTVLIARIEAYQLFDSYRLPTVVQLEVPAVELTLDIKYKKWLILDEEPKGFERSVPDSFESKSLQTVLDELKKKSAQQP